jgi:hypothetical protein
MYLKECAPGYYRTTPTPIFIVALLTIAKLRKQPRCPTTDEQAFLHVVYEYYSAKKMNGITLFAGKWTELENIMLSKPGSKGQRLNVFPHECARPVR